ncbi:MAG: cytochrome c biogenesis protein CcsA [Deltaproteobacteria bacterium]|nr:cytochrome c biogenesis protein CcsA [Deltaproteobacteria bacterium]
MPQIEAILTAATMVAYAAGFALSVAGLIIGKERLFRWGRWATALGLLVHTGALTARTVVSGHLPIATPYENATLAAWSIVLLTFLAPRRWRMYQAAGTGAVPLALVIIGWGLMGDTVASPMGVSLKSVWLYVHVFFAILAYAAFSIGAGAAAVLLIKHYRPDKGLSEKLPSLEELELVLFRYVVFGFLTEAVMIAAGSIWAKDLWGSYWSWDPVETWSLVSWLVYGVLIHLWVVHGWRGHRIAWVGLFAIVFVIIAYFGVGFLLQGTAHVFTVPPPPTFLGQ